MKVLLNTSSREVLHPWPNKTNFTQVWIPKNCQFLNPEEVFFSRDTCQLAKAKCQDILTGWREPKRLFPTAKDGSELRIASNDCRCNPTDPLIVHTQVDSTFFSMLGCYHGARHTLSLKRNAPWINWLPLWPKVKVKWPRLGFKTLQSSSIYTLPQKKRNFPRCISSENECSCQTIAIFHPSKNHFDSLLTQRILLECHFVPLINITLGLQYSPMGTAAKWFEHKHYSSFPLRESHVDDISCWLTYQ